VQKDLQDVEVELEVRNDVGHLQEVTRHGKVCEKYQVKLAGPSSCAVSGVGRRPLDC